MSTLTYLQAIVLGLLQGVTELFPISSLGHSVLVPAWLGWDNLVKSQSESESFFLAFLVGLHVATAMALLLFFWRTWVDIIKGLGSSIRDRRVETSTQRLAWLLIVATIPAGITGLLFEHVLRTQFAKPLAASVFLTINALILFAGEWARRTSEVRELALVRGEQPGAPVRRLATFSYGEAAIIGTSQILALLAGISRSGITMVAGLLRGLNNEDAARFSFLLATPIILAAGVYKVGDLITLGTGVYPQILVGSVCAFGAALVSVRFLTRYFQSRNLIPFAIYSLIAGIASLIYFGLIK